jgi:hypothetical protein
MTMVNRSAVWASALIVLAVLHLHVHRARATDAAGSPAVTLAMTPAPLVVPRLAEPTLLCGNRWVNTTYVLGSNCMKACLNEGHSAFECQTTYVSLCHACWATLLGCAKNGPPATQCPGCTLHYAACMKPFFQ